MLRLLLRTVLESSVKFTIIFLLCSLEAIHVQYCLLFIVSDGKIHSHTSVAEDNVCIFTEVLNKWRHCLAYC